jgi:hypothetical protein
MVAGIGVGSYSETGFNMNSAVLIVMLPEI